MIKLTFIDRWLKTIALMGAMVLVSPSVFAAFEDTGTGARPTAMGDAYQGVVDDNQSLMYNPAGLAQVRRYELSTEYAKLYTGLTDGSNLSQFYFGYAQPLRNNGTVAFGWKQFSLDNLYTERTLSLGYGEWITSRIAWGVALKQLYHAIGSPGITVDNAGNVTNGTPTFFTKNGNSKSAYSGDLGVLFRATSRQLLSLSIQDVNQPNVALSGTDEDLVPQTVRAGYSYKADHNLTLAGAVTRRQSLTDQQDVTWTGALEKWWMSTDSGDFALRASLATGSRQFQQGGFGASYRVSHFQIDYGFVFNLQGVTPGASTMGTQRFSITYAFGNPPAPTVKDLKPHAKPLTAEEEAKQHRSTMDSLFKNDLDNIDRPAVVAPVAAVAPTPAPAQAPVAVSPTQVPVAAVVPTPVVAPPVPVAVPVAPTTATSEDNQQTAQLMTSTPVIPPVVEPAAPTPVAVIRTVPANVQPSVQPADVTVPLRNPQAAPAPIVPLTRVELFSQVQTMVSAYADLAAQHGSAEAKLNALAPIYDKLQGYLQGSGSELIDYITREEELNAESKDYTAMTWDGRSAQDRLRAIDRTLENHMTAVFSARVWNKHDRRDLAYKTWLDQALAQAQRMDAQKVSVHQRVLYWGQMAQKAHDFEILPADLIVEAPVVPVATVEKVAKPVVHKKTKLAMPPASAILRTNDDGTFVYKVQEGDTLINLAERFYGAYKTWRDIYYLNQDRLGRGGDLTVGQTLVMPKKERK